MNLHTQEKIIKNKLDKINETIIEFLCFAWGVFASK